MPFTKGPSLLEYSTSTLIDLKLSCVSCFDKENMRAIDMCHFEVDALRVVTWFSHCSFLLPDRAVYPR